jgi:hypothetical protein
MIMLESRWISRYSEGLWAARPGLKSWQGKIFLFSTTCRQAGGGGTQPLIEWVPETLFPRVKWQEREADNSPPSNVEVKNGEAMPPLPHTSSWHSIFLIKLRKSF